MGDFPETLKIAPDGTVDMSWMDEPQWRLKALLDRVSDGTLSQEETSEMCGLIAHRRPGNMIASPDSRGFFCARRK